MKPCSINFRREASGERREYFVKLLSPLAYRLSPKEKPHVKTQGLSSYNYEQNSVFGGKDNYVD
jgi:hypothetical protein